VEVAGGGDGDIYVYTVPQRERLLLGTIFPEH